MLAPDMIIQSSSGSFYGTTGTASLPSPPTPGNWGVLVMAWGGGATLGVTSGTIIRDSGTGVNARIIVTYGMFSGTDVVIGDAPSISVGSNAAVTWTFFEIDAPSFQVFPLAVDASAFAASASATTQGVSTSANAYDTAALFVWTAYQAAGGTPPTYSGVSSSGLTGALGTSTAVGATDGTVATGTYAAWGFSETAAIKTASATQAGAAGPMAVVGVLFAAAGTQYVPDLLWMGGAEVGSTAGLTASSLGSPYVDTQTNTTVAAGGRTGNYCFRVSTAAAATGGFNLASGGGAIEATTSGLLVQRFSFRLPSLPAGDFEVWSAGGAVLRYRAASGKLGLQFTGGTEVLSNAPITAATWVSVDVRVNHKSSDFSSTYAPVTPGPWSADWQVTYTDGTRPVPQTQATLAAQTGSPGISTTFGWTVSQTGTAEYDDVAISVRHWHFPLGDHRVYPLRVDGAATPTVTGTIGNFALVTSNAAGATLAAGNLATARDNLRDLPVTFGGTASGVCQVTAAANDYLTFPLETVNLASLGGAIRGVRVCVAGWAASATTALINVWCNDGTADTASIVAGGTDPNFDNATEQWACLRLRQASLKAIDWTNAKLDALTLRVGKSTDATPDIGILGAVVEAAVRIGTTLRVAVQDGATVDATLEADSGAVIGYTLTAPADSAATAVYTVRGSDVIRTVAAGGTDTYFVGPDATADDVTFVTAYRS